MPDIFLTEDEILQIKTVLAEKQALREKLDRTTHKLNELTRKFNLHTHSTYESTEYGQRIDSESAEPSADYFVAETEED